MTTRWHHIMRTTNGGRVIGDILIEEVTSTQAMKYAAAKYPGERHQWICSMDKDTPTHERVA